MRQATPLRLTLVLIGFAAVSALLGRATLAIVSAAIAAIAALTILRNATRNGDR